ncbi:hypothetical protein O3P69_000130 [Scylla paramamosain]|uniref:Uncharacterized protein n=1 Tax=Scylla paramamosain TaxID=85552 RepID=A0AAW0UVA8_SCYPA
MEFFGCEIPPPHPPFGPRLCRLPRSLRLATWRRGACWRGGVERAGVGPSEASPSGLHGAGWSSGASSSAGEWSHVLHTPRQFHSVYIGTQPIVSPWRWSRELSAGLWQQARVREHREGGSRWAALEAGASGCVC